MRERNKSVQGKIFLFGILFLFLINFVTSANIGISPASINFKEVLRGGYSERIVVISVDSEEEVKVRLKPRGEISEWLNFSLIEFSVSKSKPYFLIVSILPPNDIANGDYSGFLRVEVDSSSKSIEEHAVGTIKSTLDLAISVGVTDIEITRCVASRLEVLSAEKGDEVVLKMNVKNEGNIRLKPNVIFDIWDFDKVNIIETKEFLGGEILPSKEEVLEFRFSSDKFEEGQYWSDVYVSQCSYSGILTFDVLEKGALSARGVLLNILTKGEVNVGETSLVIVNFKNTGEKEVDAQFRGEVTKNGKVVDILESPISKVPILGVEEFNFYFTPKVAGKYIVSGRVFYGGKKTFELSSSLVVLGNNFSFVWVVYFLFVFIIGFLFYRIRKEKKIYLNKLRKIK